MNAAEAPTAAPMLEGLRILDFTPLLPGPFATSILADLGADVVKVEPPSGDFARGMPVEMFRVANRNKRSIVIDLKDPRSAPVVERLARTADVAIEAFRPGVAARLGIGAESLRAINPRLVYCSISGFGQTGSARDAPGHDFNYLAASGALSFLGHWGDTKPHRSGLPVADLAGGSYAVIAILAALMQRQRTKAGTTLELSLTESMMSFMAVRRGLDTEEPGRWHLYPTNDTFAAADGRSLALGLVEPHFWNAFVSAVGELEPRLCEERFSEEEGRRAAGDALSALIGDLMATRTSSDWLARFEGTDVPVQLVRTPKEAGDFAQRSGRGLVQSLDGERHMVFPVRADDRPVACLRKLAPALGADTDALLEELGFDEPVRRALVGEGGPCRAQAGNAP